MKPIHIRTLRRLRRGAGTAALLAILVPQLAVANPLGPQVISGQASFAVQGKTLTVTNSDRAIINWQAFSIAGGELTRFIQPTATSAVLNRVIGNNPSAIYGALQSNGRVYLVNSNGIFMGPTATIDVNGLVASTLNISDGDFKAGRMNFSGGPLAGRIENQGAIRTPAGGSIYLIAPDVTNSGVINAPNGDVLLAAGKQVSLVESTTPEIAVVVSAPENAALNLGRIIAEAGRVGIYGGLIRHRGVISADSAVMDKTGAIHFRATRDLTLDKESATTANGPRGGRITAQSTEGTTLVSGAVEAKGSADKGGTIQILGTRVGVTEAARIDASGDQGGGEVLVGGDYQGKNPAVQNAAATYFGKEAVIKADALTRGDGGRVILWAEAATRAYGRISARGGELAGDGGFVETSGGYLDVQRAPDVRAPNGKGGTWLLDPYDVTIINSTPYNSDSSGAPPDDVTYYPTGSGSIIDNNILSTALLDSNVIVSGDISQITVSDPITWGNANSLTLQAANDILINAAITGSNGTLVLNAPGSIGQYGSGNISVSQLELLGGGTYAFGFSTNSIGTLIGNVNQLVFFNRGNLIIGNAGLASANGVQIRVLGSEIQPGSLTVSGDVSTASGYADLAAHAGIAINGNVHGQEGVYLDGVYSAGTFGPITGSGTITGPFISAGAAGGINLKSEVSELSANNWVSGSVQINNTGDLYIGRIVNTSAGSGEIYVNNQGAITTGGAEQGVHGYGNVTLIANSPLTIGAGGVTSSAGNISLTAGYVPESGRTGDTLTLNGPLDAAGSVTLKAGNEIIKNSTIAYGTTYTETPNLNGSTPPEEPCPTGQQRVDGICQPIICPTGQKLVGNTCEPITCPTGQKLVGNTCEPITCPTGQKLVGNACEPITCPTGQKLVGNTCEPITCPTGQKLVGNACEPITCPTGQQLVGNICEPITCPTGQQLVGNLCQPIICPTGQQLVGNLCQPIICTGGQVLVGNLCSCPAGTIDYAGVCKTPSIVPGTGNSTVIYVPVPEELTEPLQVLVQSIINAVDPSLLGTAGSPGGGTGDDPNKPKKNYCN